MTARTVLPYRTTKELMDAFEPLDDDAAIGADERELEHA